MLSISRHSERLVGVGGSVLPAGGMKRKRTPLPRPRFTPQQRAQLRHEFAGRQGTACAFAAQPGLGTSPIFHWLRQRRAAPASTSGKAGRLHGPFQEVALAKALGTGDPWAGEVRRPARFCAGVPRLPPPGSLAPALLTPRPAPLRGHPSRGLARGPVGEATLRFCRRSGALGGNTFQGTDPSLALPAPGRTAGHHGGRRGWVALDT